jgi:hypothetical protein
MFNGRFSIRLISKQKVEREAAFASLNRLPDGMSVSRDHASRSVVISDRLTNESAMIRLSELCVRPEIVIPRAIGRLIDRRPKVAVDPMDHISPRLGGESTIHIDHIS